MARDDRERWDRRYDDDAYTPAGAPDWLEALGSEIPEAGRALDVATGAGRVALWLAQRGLDVTAVDISSVGLDRCRVGAQARGLSLRTLALDLDEEVLPEGPFAVISCFRYLQRDLFPVFRERLAPDGVLACEIRTRRNLGRHPHPRARFLLESNELLSLCAPLDVVYYREGWVDDRAVARILARKS
jgi:SAM-dependent methyltransferase